jgi:hypothetical protein
MKALEWREADLDPLFLSAGAGSRSGTYPANLPEACGKTRKHVRNDAGTRTSESVMCKFMGQPVGNTWGTPVTQAPSRSGGIAAWMPPPSTAHELARPHGGSHA